MPDLLQPIINEPLKKNRWLAIFPSELGIQSWMLSSGQRPSFEGGETEIPFLDTSIFVAGRFTWNSIDITLRSYFGPSTTQAVMEWLRTIHESSTGRSGYQAGYKKQIFLVMLDPTGVAVEKWLLDGTFITNVNFGDLSMDDDGVADITLTLRFDRAINLF